LLIEDQGESGQTAASLLGTSPQPEAPPEPFFKGETASNLRLALAKQGNPGAPKANEIGMPLGERALGTLIAAEERAENAEVRLLHILWGLVSDKESSVSSLLSVNGVTVKQVEDAIQR
jgi:hypothetical protein